MGGPSLLCPVWPQGAPIALAWQPESSPAAPSPHLMLDRSQKQMRSQRGDGKSSIFPGGLKEQPQAQGWGSLSPARDVTSPQRGVPHLSPSQNRGTAHTHPAHVHPQHTPASPRCPPQPAAPRLQHLPAPCPTSPTPACTGARPCTNAGCAVTQLTRPAAACFAPANYGPPRRPHSSSRRGLASLRLLTAQGAGGGEASPVHASCPAEPGGLASPPCAPASVGACAIYCRAG